MIITMSANGVVHLLENHNGVDKCLQIGHDLYIDIGEINHNVFLSFVVINRHENSIALVATEAPDRIIAGSMFKHRMVSFFIEEEYRETLKSRLDEIKKGLENAVFYSREVFKEEDRQAQLKPVPKSEYRYKVNPTDVTPA